MGDNIADMFERLKIDPRPNPLQDYGGSYENLQGPLPPRRRLLRPTTGFVYLLCQDSNHCDMQYRPAHFYKLGASRNPEKRRQDLQTGNPHRLVAKRCREVPAYRSAETRVRNGFPARWKVTLGGGTEWLFVPDEEKQEMYRQFEHLTRINVEH